MDCDPKPWIQTSCATGREEKRTKGRFGERDRRRRRRRSDDVELVKLEYSQSEEDFKKRRGRGKRDECAIVRVCIHVCEQ